MQAAQQPPVALLDLALIVIAAVWSCLLVCQPASASSSGICTSISLPMTGTLPSDALKRTGFPEASDQIGNRSMPELAISNASAFPELREQFIASS